MENRKESRLTEKLINGILVLGIAGALTLDYYIDDFNPPMWYEDTYKEISECVNGDKDGFPSKFYSVRGDGFPCPGGTCIGMYLDLLDGMVFLSQERLYDKNLVRHELTHANGITNEDSVFNILQSCYGNNK